MCSKLTSYALVSTELVIKPQASTNGLSAVQVLSEMIISNESNILTSRVLSHFNRSRQLLFTIKLRYKDLEKVTQFASCLFAAMHPSNLWHPMYFMLFPQRPSLTTPLCTYPYVWTSLPGSAQLACGPCTCSAHAPTHS